MQYTGFRVQNFKGIKDTKIKISESQDARIYTLVGLNESGKTTILEAIHSFSPDNDTKVIVGSDLSTDKADSNIVPRYAVSDFTGDIAVTADLIIDKEEKERIIKYMRANHSFETQFNNMNHENFSYSRFHRYENGDYAGKFRSCTLQFSIKSSKQRKFRTPDKSERLLIFNFIETLFPKIAYFPTFVFEFPDKIYLSRRGGDRKNAFYRQLFQDILDFDGRGHKISEHIVDRVRKEEFVAPWSSFFNIFRASGEIEKIDQVIDRAAQVVTRTIFRKWNDIFQEDASGKEVIIPWQTDEGLPTSVPKGVSVPSEKHDIYIQFRIKDGTNRYNVEDRSLGFRWFFAFLLFTQFRAARREGGATIFLFDEPASNLHSAAQQKLIESFLEIARAPNLLIYSTHSHYMIEPKWLDQTFIIQNGASKNDESVLDSGLVDDSSLDIKAIPYREFIHEFPSKNSYFQPILDRLEVVPSKFDFTKGGIIVEGKSDYYILRYISEILLNRKLVLFPALGAGTLGSLIALHRGWGLPVRILLDGDVAGKREKIRYQKEFALLEAEIKTLDEIAGGLTDIESLLSADDVKRIVDLNPDKNSKTKKILFMYFQERLVSQKKEKFDKFSMANFKIVCKELNVF